MTDTATLPHFRQAVVEQGGTITRPWGAWVQRVNASLNTGALGVGELVANMAAVATALGSPDGTVAGIPAQSGYLSASTSLQPQMSVVGSGTLANGLMFLALANDAQHPGNRTAYGTDSDGAKGFFPIADAFTATAGNVTLTTGADGVTDVDLADLADSGSGTLLAITRDAKGRISGSKPVTEGANVTITDVGASVEIAATGGGGGAMSLVGTATVTGSAATNITLSGLDLAADGCYFLEMQLTNPVAGATVVSLFYNADAVATNYYNQFFGSTGSGASNARANSGVLAGLPALTSFVATGWIKAGGDGRPRAVISINRAAAVAVELVISTHIRNNTANVTSLTINSSVAASFAIGSTVSLYKVEP